MSHQKDCYRLGIVIYSSDPGGDCVGPLVGVPEAIFRLYDHVAGHAALQRPSTTAKTVLKTASDATDIEEI